MKNTNVLAIFGYNNSRIYDVEKIKQLAHEQLEANILLIKEGVNEQDLQVTPYCFDSKPENTELAGPLKKYLELNNLTLIGCLPFSDKGVVGASYVAEIFGLFGDDKNTAAAMLDKNAFRSLESAISMESTKYCKPFFKKIHDSESLFSLLKKVGTYFIKPTAEGNSRGCMKISSESDLVFWLEGNAQYLKDGVMCEEYLSSGNEFSFDGVNDTYWITEKYTTTGAFRAEYQHIVPAPMNNETELNVQNIMRHLLPNLGSKGGAFHHEFFILGDNRLASVEPNRRPAGMWIWDLASWSFEDFNPWIDWIKKCSGKNTTPKALKRMYYSGVRGVISSTDGKIESINEVAINEQLGEMFGENNYRLSILKTVGAVARQDPQDNADFLAFVALRHKEANHLKNNLALANRIIINNIKVTK